MTRKPRSSRPQWLVFLLLLALPASAHAHGAIPGLEGFVNGLAHPVTTPAHVLVILALGLLVGRRTPPDMRTPFIVFLPALGAGLLFTLVVKAVQVSQPWLLVMVLIGAALVALDRAIPRLAERAIFAGAGLALGLDSGIEAGSTAVVIKTLLGTWLMVAFLVFDVAYYSSLAGQKSWARIGRRVLGSWIVAIALLMLAFALRRPDSAA